MEYSLSEPFQQAALALADEADLDELEAVRCLLEAQDDMTTLGRSLLECGIIRFHQQRKYALDALRLLLEMDSEEDDVFDEAIPMEAIQVFVSQRVLSASGDRSERIVPRCMRVMHATRQWTAKLGDKIAAAKTLGQNGAMSEEAETIEYQRVSLVQQHEVLGVILARCIEKRQADVTNFEGFMSVLRKAERYDNLLVHLMPATGAYMTVFGSVDGGCDLIQVRELNNKLFPASGEQSWALPFLQAAVRAWWLAVYSGFYLDDPPEAAIPPGTDLDEEDRQRAKQFQESLKEGAFDFILSIAGDIKPPDWHDSVRAGMHRWLQRKSPALNADMVQFSDFFQRSLVNQIEEFIDSFISNLPDVLRKLRVEEDEQRQLSQTHEQDLDLERFLLIIAYAYENRPDAAMEFWRDPESNLNGFLHWASRRASTPLVTAFCEMLQAISCDDQCADHAHTFLLEEGHQSSGKLRRSQSLTWAQIFRELKFFLDKAKQKPTQAPTVRFRAGKPQQDVVETEPESAMMLESYLRLMTKLATENETARLFLLQNTSFNLVEAILELASTPIPSRLRGCSFMALKALMTRKTTSEGYAMWNCLDQWVTGGYVPVGHGRPPQLSPQASMERTFDEMSRGFEDPESLIQLLLALIRPSIDSSSLNDTLTFPENLGSAFRASGIEVYVDYVMGVFAAKSELQDVYQTGLLRLCCLDFMLACLDTFNEDLIVMANETNLNIDSIVSTTDLATYVRMHPFARVMEWMYNDKIMAAIFNTIHQEPIDVGNAAPDSPLILGILRAVDVVSKVLDLQATYLDLVRPIIRQQSGARHQPVAKAAYATFEDGLVSRLQLVVDMGNYCGIGHPDLTLSCLKLLERMSASSRITALWSGGRQNHRNKAIVAMEANGEHESIARSFISELLAQLDLSREAESASYITKIYILDFLYQCLRETPGQPTIAHLLLGFKTGVDSLSVEPNSLFEERTSLFHGLLRVLLDTPSSDASGVRQWFLALKVRAMRVLQILWSSPLSAPLVIEELRENEFLFHLLLRETLIRPDLPWEGHSVQNPDFLLTDGSTTLLDLLSLRSMTLEYIAMELCMISQGRMPSVKRRIFEALNGQIRGDENETIQVPTIFDLYDFHLPPDAWANELQVEYHKDLDLSACIEVDAEENSVYNMKRVDEMLQLKRSEAQAQGVVISAAELAKINDEEARIVQYLISFNRERQISTQGLKVLRTWVKLLLVMVEANDFKGTAQTQFFLQALQAILPSLEAYAADRPEEAYELAKLAKVLLSKLYQANDAADKNSLAIGNLISDKLYQVFQICLQAVGKWAGTAELRAMYYEICYRYLTGMPDEGMLAQNRSKTVKAIKVYGERLINVICDDAYNGEPSCQTAALILLGTLVSLDHQEGGTHIVDALNRLNFIGILVDSLRNIMQEWQEAFSGGESRPLFLTSANDTDLMAGHREQENFQNARLALLQQLSQTRHGAKHILHANLLRSLEVSRLFAADPELQSDANMPHSSSIINGHGRSNNRALEVHYDLLAKTVRIIGAALVSRGSHNVVQGRKFLQDHRMLVSHVLKRSAGIGTGEDEGGRLEEKIGDLAEALIVVIAATGFIEVS